MPDTITAAALADLFGMSTHKQQADSAGSTKVMQR